MGSRFLTPVDIANRVCQHLGVTRITSFADDSKQAGEIASCYDKLRRAELRRNVWTFACRRAPIRPLDTATLLLAPPVWSAIIAYPKGAVVDDGSGVYWISLAPINLGNAPGQGTAGSLWDMYFGSMTIEPFDPTTTTTDGEGDTIVTQGIAYYGGELVYLQVGVGSGAPGFGSGTGVQVYLSLQNSNTDTPNVVQAWTATVVNSLGATVPMYYTHGNMVLYNGFLYYSMIDANAGNTPGTYAPWQSSLTYDQEDQVYSTVNGHVYNSLTNNNIGSEPSANPAAWNDQGFITPWSESFSTPASDLKWVNVQATVSALNPVYPIGAGPSSDVTTKNLFHLPGGYLRVAPQQPKAGNFSYLGAPSGMRADDWEFNGDFIVSSDVNLIVLRFVADVTDVVKMDDMFCEALAARIALETCETITQSTEKMNSIGASYKKFRDDAATVNAIEQDSTELPVDDWIACRW